MQCLFACSFEAIAEKQTAGFLEYKCVVGSRLQTKSGGSGDEWWWGFGDLDSTGFGLWTAIKMPPTFGASSINDYNMPSTLVYRYTSNRRFAVH
jgi:hypothetical protein